MPDAPFVAYFDETGHSSYGEFVGMAGFVASRRDWELFPTRWAAVLKAEQVPHFHAREFSHSVGAFRAWKKDEPRRRRFLESLLSVIRTVNPTPVGAIVDNAALRSLPDLIRSRIKDPYCHCFQTVSRGAAIVTLSECPEATVDIVVADTPERRGDVTAIWELLPTAMDHGKRLGDLSLATPLSQLQLQAADFLAYEMNLEFERILERKVRKQRWPMKQFLRIAGIAPLLRYFDGPELQRLYTFRV
jgi:hypothetical protein